MMQRMPLVGVTGMVGRFRPEQIANQSTWTKVPEQDRVFASMHVVRVIPSNGSTECRVNPIDSADDNYIEPPNNWDRVVPAGRMRY